MVVPRIATSVDHSAGLRVKVGETTLARHRSQFAPITNGATMYIRRTSVSHRSVLANVT